MKSKKKPVNSGKVLVREACPRCMFRGSSHSLLEMLMTNRILKVPMVSFDLPRAH